MMRRTVPVAVAAAFAFAVCLDAQKPAPADVLKAAADYLVDYAQRLSVVGAEEEYTQYDTRVASSIRRFQSDFVIVGLSEGQFVSFRDVYSIDSNQLRPRDGRLFKLLEKPPTVSVQEEAAGISNEALRYYVNANLRALDMPTLALVYLRGPNQAKSTFTLDGVKNQDGAQVAILKFKVTDATGLLPTPGDATTSGRFWIDAATGTVRQTELSISGTGFMFRVQAKYSHDKALGLWLPAELYQQCDISGTVQGMTSLGAVASPEGVMSGARQSLEGRTKYSKYRRVPTTSAGTDAPRY